MLCCLIEDGRFPVLTHGVWKSRAHRKRARERLECGFVLNSAQPAEPESRDEQKIKDFMVQKYERKRWYIPPQQVSNSNSSQAAPEPKPLKQLLGENTPSVSVQVSTNEHFLVNQ